jgi:hypothetical protein
MTTDDENTSFLKPTNAPCWCVVSPSKREVEKVSFHKSIVDRTAAQTHDRKFYYSFLSSLSNSPIPISILMLDYYNSYIYPPQYFHMPHHAPNPQTIPTQQTLNTHHIHPSSPSHPPLITITQATNHSFP